MPYKVKTFYDSSTISNGFFLFIQRDKRVVTCSDSLLEHFWTCRKNIYKLDVSCNESFLVHNMGSHIKFYLHEKL